LLKTPLGSFKRRFSFCGTLELGLNGIFLGLNKIDFVGFAGLKWDVSFLGYTFGYIEIRIDVRILRISPIRTDFGT
jgi:hypothetical protein